MSQIEFGFLVSLAQSGSRPGKASVEFSSESELFDHDKNLGIEMSVGATTEFFQIKERTSSESILCLSLRRRMFHFRHKSGEIDVRNLTCNSCLCSLQISLERLSDISPEFALLFAKLIYPDQELNQFTVV